MTKEQMRQEDRQMILNRSQWPHLVVLPMKRWVTKDGKDHMECACILDDGTKTYWQTLYVCLIFDLPRTREQLEACKQYRYETIEQMQADGWVVE